MQLPSQILVSRREAALFKLHNDQQTGKMLALVEEINSPNFQACYVDTGHANILPLNSWILYTVHGLTVGCSVY